MGIISKVWALCYGKISFLLEHKWGLVKPKDIFAISKSVLKNYLPPNAVIIDCGAHVGSDSVGLARVFSNGTIHSFEPVPHVFAQLKKNTTSYSNIKRYQMALSNRDGTASLFVSSGTSDGSSSLLAPSTHLQDHPDVLFEEKIEVEARTLDTWAKENKIAAVDFLWLDMQGFEFAMLSGSVTILPTVKAIYSEVSTKETYKGCIQYDEFKPWLEQKGFCVAVEIIPAGSDMGNVLFVRE